MVGQGVEPSARELAEAAGLDVSGHSARMLETQQLDEADLVLVMSDGQRQAIAQRWPPAMGKVMRLGHWLDQGAGGDIPDPYRRGPDYFSRVHRLLDLATDEWGKRL